MSVPLEGGAKRRRPLRVGVQLPEIERDVGWPELLAMARRAELVGLDSVWVGDHLLYRTPAGPRGPWEAWSLLAALAASTDRIRLGPLVAATSFHAPAMLAKKAATIDEISGGRLILGLGAGWNDDEYRAYGFPVDHRVDRFEEAFTIIRTLLREGAVDVAGRWYEARDCVLVPPGPRVGGPPLLVGCRGPRMLAIAAPFMNAWNAWYSWYGNVPEGLAPLMHLVDHAAEDAGRDPAAIERTAAMLVRLPGGTGRVQGDARARPVVPLEGSPEMLAGSLHAFAAAGIGHVQLVLDPITEDAIAALEPVLEVLDAG